MKNENGEILTNRLTIHSECNGSKCIVKKFHGHTIAYMILTDGTAVAYDEQFHRFLTQKEIEDVL